MPRSSHSIASLSHTATVNDTETSVKYVHSISEAGRLLPSSSRWSSIEIDSNNPSSYESLPSRFSKSIDFNLTITDKQYFKRFVYVSSSFIFLILLLYLLLHFLPNEHQHHRHPPKNLTLALNQALLFFDAQKSGVLPKNENVKFRGDSGLGDGNGSLVGGFYDSGNNIKFSFTTAYTITLLSWTVIEYHHKYEDINELHHIKDIIKWGSDYLLKLFIPQHSSSSPSKILFSQVGSTWNDTTGDNDINCWQRPEDMRYERPFFSCDRTASDLAGEIIAALSAASLVFIEDSDYSKKLTKTAEELFNLTTKENPVFVQGIYTKKDECGGEAIQFYNSTGYEDELVWGGIWLFFATGNTSYLRYATDHFVLAEEQELSSEKGVFYWNNKLPAITVLLTRLRFFRDLGYPYEETFRLSTNNTDLLMCSYLSSTVTKTQGGLTILKPDHGAPLEYAATSSFLSKLYSDYLDLLPRSGCGCVDDTTFSLESLRSFSMSQVNYILGDNPMKMSYLVGFGNNYPKYVHHRGASLPWDHQWHSCLEGIKWFDSKEPNPNDLLGAMVRGPDQNDIFLDERDEPRFTEPTISSNAGLVAALIALHEPPNHSSSQNGNNLLGIDNVGIFRHVHLIP